MSISLTEQLRLSIIIPAFNEQDTIFTTVSKLKHSVPDAEIIVVDDGSADNTFQEASRAQNVRVLKHPYNRGYGAALKTGMRASHREIVVWFDADGQHSEKSLEDILRPVLREDVDASLGARERNLAFQIKRAPGKMVLKIVSQMVARRKIPDLNCGFRAFKRNMIIPYLGLLPDGFSASSTSTLIFLKKNYRIEFVNLPLIERAGGKSTVKMVRDGLLTLKLVFKILLLFDALRFFTLLSFIQGLAAVSYSAYFIINVDLGVPPLGVIMAVSSMLTFFVGVISWQISDLRLEQADAKIAAAESATYFNLGEATHPRPSSNTNVNSDIAN